MQTFLKKMSKEEFISLIVNYGSDDKHLEIFNDEELFVRLVFKRDKEYEEFLACKMQPMTDNELTEFAWRHGRMIMVCDTRIIGKAE